MANKKITLHPIDNGVQDNTTNLYPKTNTEQVEGLSTALSAKQDSLVSGTNIKTINNTSLLGSGNINVIGSTMCYEEEGNWIAFRSPHGVVLSVYNNSKNWDGTIEYSTDKTNWNAWDGTEQIEGDDVIYLRGINNSYITANLVARWILNDNNSAYPVTCSGNIENLLDYQTVMNGQHPTMGERCFQSMFLMCSSLIMAPTLQSPVLSNSCYESMFKRCTSLVLPPELPATTLATNCCLDMFSGCTSLVLPPELPALVLADACYQNMFSGCTSLSKAPSLPTMTLADSCYAGMFNNCTSLTVPPALPATTLFSFCYKSMFTNCSSLVSLPSLLATDLPQRCYHSMFEGCTNIKLSTSQEGDYQTIYRIPMEGTATTSGNYVVDDMFKNTGGTFTGTPSINTTYYTSNTIIPSGN